jgi:hypothetical protein
MIRIIYPAGMTPQAWCNQMSLALSSVSQFPVVRADADWRHWAQSVARQVSMAQYKIPFPTASQPWRAWADKFVQALSEVPI